MWSLSFKNLLKGVFGSNLSDFSWLQWLSTPLLVVLFMFLKREVTFLLIYFLNFLQVATSPGEVIFCHRRTKDFWRLSNFACLVLLRAGPFFIFEVDQLRQKKRLWLFESKSLSGQWLSSLAGCIRLYSDEVTLHRLPIHFNYLFRFF